VKPDIMTCAKALGCGVPVGAFVLGEKAAEHSLEPGDHGTTYGGNPLACAAVSKVFDLFEKLDIVGHVRETAPYLEKRLDEVAARHDFIVDRRGMGFMQGLELSPDHPAGEVVRRALDLGLVVMSAGGNVIRFVPPLIITKQDIDSMVEILEKAF
ncbi:MAG TPA: aspartate aminotransferase family protein, partial [Lachnospiraceae bacterium]|nr:aspartate aminotransferase family protein [Lachnospiraceae bacterium]